jgi:hypothetical protein
MTTATGPRKVADPADPADPTRLARADRFPEQSSGELTGPFTQGFYFVVREPIRSKSNYRHAAAARRAGSWSQLAGYADRVYLAARAARPVGWQPGSLADPVAARPRIVVFLYGRTLLDTANIDKSILDACEGPLSRRGTRTSSTGAAVMASDAQVAWLSEMAERTTHNPGVLIAFARLDPGVSPRVVADAGAALAASCVNLLQP